MIRGSIRMLGAALAMATAPGAPSAARQDPSPPRAQPRALHVDAIVTDAQGRVVRGLTRDDFELVDSGTTQPLDSVEFRTSAKAAPRASASGDSAQDAPEPAAGRILALFLDEYHVSAGETTERVRAALVRFVDEQLEPDDLVAVMKPLDSIVSITLTRNRDEVRGAIQRFAGCRGDYTPRSTFEASVISRAPDAAAAARAQVVLSGLHALTTHLGRERDGRKAIVFVSEGFAADAARARQRLPEVQTIVRAAQRFDVAIYTLDPRDAAADSDGAAAMLREVARQTSGEATATTGEFAPALRRVTRDLDGYYRLAYRTPNTETGFHPIEIRVRRKGLIVRARSGYWTTPIDELRRARLSTAARPVFRAPPLRVSPMVQPWFRMTRGTGGRTRVLFMWEVKPAGATRGAARPPVSTLTLTATAPDGTALFRGRVSPVRGGIDASSPTHAVLEAAPGSLVIEMAIEDMREAVIDSDVRTITVPDLNGTRTILGTPEIVRTRTAVEFRSAAANIDTPPTATRVFNRRERLIVRAPAFGPRGSAAVVTARLLNPLGHRMRDLDPIEPAARDGIAQFDLLLASLPPGEYRIELTAASGDSDTRESFAFRVVG